MKPDYSTMTRPALVIAGGKDQSAMSTRGPDWFTDAYHRSPAPKGLLAIADGEHTLGGIAGEKVAETTDEDSARVALIADAASAYLLGALDLDAAAWATLRREAATSDGAYGIEATWSTRPGKPPASRRSDRRARCFVHEPHEELAERRPLGRRQAVERRPQNAFDRFRAGDEHSFAFGGQLGSDRSAGAGGAADESAGLHAGGEGAEGLIGLERQDGEVVQRRTGVRVKVAQGVPLHDRDVQGPQRLVTGAVVLDLQALHRLPELLDRQGHAGILRREAQLAYINMLI